MSSADKSTIITKYENLIEELNATILEMNKIANILTTQSGNLSLSDVEVLEEKAQLYILKIDGFQLQRQSMLNKLADTPSYKFLKRRDLKAAIAELDNFISLSFTEYSQLHKIKSNLEKYRKLALLNYNPTVSKINSIAKTNISKLDKNSSVKELNLVTKDGVFASNNDTDESVM